MSNVIGLSAEHEANLRKLAKYLIEFVPTYDKPKFTMRKFADINVVDGTCGSAGCAVGFATLVIEPKKPNEGWLEFSARLFGLHVKSPDDESDLTAEEALSDRRWDWCFSDAWGYVDNTPAGAGKRILQMLDHDVPTGWTLEQLESQQYEY